jgi:hypothetical protein
MVGARAADWDARHNTIAARDMVVAVLFKRLSGN